MQIFFVYYYSTVIGVLRAPTLADAVKQAGAYHGGKAGITVQA